MALNADDFNEYENENNSINEDAASEYVPDEVLSGQSETSDEGNPEEANTLSNGVMGDFLKEKSDGTEDSEAVNEFNSVTNQEPAENDADNVGNEEKSFLANAIASTNKALVKTESAETPDDYIDEDPNNSEVPPFAAGEDEQNQSSESSSGEKEKQETVYDVSDEEKKENEDISFEAKKKISSIEAEAAPPASKPKVLNKKFLLAVGLSVLCVIFILTIFMPSKKSSGSSNSETAYPDQSGLPNYKNYAQQSDAENAGHYEEITGYDSNGVPIYGKKQNENPNTETPERKTQYDENGNVIIPPIIPPSEQDKSSYIYNPSTVSTSTGSTSTISIPDTRNDSLHGKTISGIKGLTGSQQQYATDYLQTINKNSGTATNLLDGYSLPSKEEYTASILNQYKDLYAGNNTSEYSSQNDQSGKNSFYSNGRNGEGVGTGQYLSTNTIWQGTIFEAVLTSELNTDLPGEITARVAKNIYSSQDGRYLLIPQNSVLYGTYNSSISYSQNRVQVGWHTIVRPDGYAINIGNMSGTDAKGASGLKGFVNEHPFSYLRAIGLMSVLSIADSEYKNQMNNTSSDILKSLLNNSKEVTEPLGEKIVDRAINIQPTIVIRAGTKLNIVANQTLTLPPYEQIPVTEKYRKY